MNKGMSLTELAAELTRIEQAKKDFVIPSNKMSMINGRELIIDGADIPILGMSKLAHEQISERLKIPRDYYRRMQDEQPELLDRNVNTWLHSNPERRFVRTVDGNVRAMLSDKYMPKENYALASELLPILHQQGDIDIVSTNLSDKHMFIKVLSPKLEGEVKVGQLVRGGISVRNSEVGCGAFDVSLFVMVLACMNGMIREHSMKSYHVGKRLEAEETDGIGFYSAETIDANAKAFMLKVRDTLKFAFNKEKFDEEIALYRAAAENPLNIKRINDTIEDVTKRYNVTKAEGEDILGRLLAGGDFTQWGLANAVTNLANDLTDYERSTDMEKIGGQIIDLNPGEWRTVAKLAA